MPPQKLSQWNPAFSASATPLVPKPVRGNDPSRRVAHGGSAWSLPVGANALRQPQDGTPEALGRLKSMTSIASRRHISLPHEAEDAKLTGGTRSLSRRVLGLNVTKPIRGIIDDRLIIQVA